MSSHDNTQSMNIKGATSVKYSGQLPGGNTTISLGGGYGGDDDRFPAKAQAPKKEEEEEKEDDEAQVVAGKASGVTTSVKYSGQPPGGKSNFTLG